MSRREIVAVCELAAHLALRDAKLAPLGPATIHNKAGQFAQDAMTLQRLGRRARRHIEKCDARQGIYWGASVEHERIERQGDQLLAPYGLTAKLGNTGLCIIGLPSNGDGEGFGV